MPAAGESGSGKATLASLLLGFVAPSEGAFYRVDHALVEPLRLLGLVQSRHQAREMVEGTRERVGLHPEDTLNRLPHELSGGQRQRLMVARALLLRPKLLIADEPVFMIDASLRAIVLNRLRTLNIDLGIPILYITHDLTTAYHVAHAIIVLYRGTVVEAGDAEAVIQHPQHPYTRLLADSIPSLDLDAMGQRSASFGRFRRAYPGIRRRMPLLSVRTPCHAAPRSYRRFMRPTQARPYAASCTRTRRASRKRD